MLTGARSGLRATRAVREDGHQREEAERDDQHDPAERRAHVGVDQVGDDAVGDRDHAADGALVDVGDRGSDALQPSSPPA